MLFLFFQKKSQERKNEKVFFLQNQSRDYQGFARISVGTKKDRIGQTEIAKHPTDLFFSNNSFSAPIVLLKNKIEPQIFLLRFWFFVAFFVAFFGVLLLFLFGLFCCFFFGFFVAFLCVWLKSFLFFVFPQFFHILIPFLIVAFISSKSTNKTKNKKTKNKKKVKSQQQKACLKSKTKRQNKKDKNRKKKKQKKQVFIEVIDTSNGK